MTDPALSRFPSILAEYQWMLLAARLRQRAPDAELRALGAEVLQFLHRSGGRGHLLLTDQVLASD
ncbi:hypothetical protein [Deinococcus radiotolerans]|uniref:Uncharacterized protein n=1 Tax=Deinococcus radiotolerans TaxID=1309407 RepID=A0ABQ2FRJ8_9DEIO|nr:hypothetical protein [Deinococcus radiotolerans]GGL20124.1 hypothetical protein GCM10010844_43780 [Deinococcus radiotolerans]